MIQNPVNYTISGGGGIMNLIPGISQGMTLGNQFAQIQQNQLAAQQAQDMALAKAEEEKAKAARLAEIRAKIADRTFTPGDLAEYAEKVSPEAAKQVREYITTLSEQERDGHLSSISKPWAALASGEPAVAKDLIGMTIDGYKRVGDEEAVAYLTNVQNDIDEDPNGALESLSIFISAFPKGKDVVQSYIDQKKAPGDRAKTQSDILKIAKDMEYTDAQIAKMNYEMKLAQEGKLPPEKMFEQEEKLRKELNLRTALYQDLGTTYGNLQESASAKTGAGDIALITSFMKMLDPGSVVRETEFAKAQDTGGLVTQLQGMIEKAKTGKIFPDTKEGQKQRQDYVDLALKYYQSAQRKKEQDIGFFQGIAQGYGLDFNKINPDYAFETGKGGL